jgi:CubicO group peptidase (beta-lactamase class C family)
MRSAIGYVRSGGLALSVLCLLLTAGQTGWANDASTIQEIVETFAQAAIQQGVTPGVGVGIVYKSRLYTLAFGHADVASQTPFSTDSIFEIGSNTKVFTTNLLGQAVFEKRLKLSDSLSQIPGQLGTFMVPLTGRVTLEELGDFTSGFPDLAPLCSPPPKVPGCLPSGRPPISQYSAQDFVDFFLNTAPMKYNDNPPLAVPSLPAPYFYSDFSVGLLGLLLGTPPGRPVSDNSLNIWLKEVHSRILRPLGMTSTYLYVPANVPEARIAKGYSLALAKVTEQQVTGGQITGITVLDGGAGYTSPPSVTISGGGGSDAAASAVLQGDIVNQINVTAPGSGYTARPEAVTTGGGATKSADLLPIVAGGEVIVVEVVDGGSGYTSVPAVMIAGGLNLADPKAKNATAIADIGNGRVTSVTVTNGGAGYLSPLTVTVAPGNAESSGVPIWAPAGALLSTVDDLTRFAAAALGRQPRTGTPWLPAPLAAGFKTAETAYACAAANPGLSTCPAGTSFSGLAWVIIPADSTNASPEVVTKNGGLTGFSSQIFLVPEREVAVVVLVNAETHGVDSETLGVVSTLAGAPAQVLAHNIGYALLNALPQ